METNHHVHPTSVGQRWRRRALAVGGGGFGVYILTANHMCFLGAVLSVVLSAVMLTLMVGIVVAALDSAYNRDGHLGEGYARSIGTMLAVSWAFAVTATLFTVQALSAWTGLDQLPADMAQLADVIGVQRRRTAVHLESRRQRAAVRRLLRDPREDDR